MTTEVTTESRVETRRLPRWLEAIQREVVDANRFDTTITLTLILLILYPGYVWYLGIAIKMLGIAAILCRSLAYTPLFWFVIFGAHASIQNVLYWHISDNHQFLYSYWFLALGCSLWSKHSEQTASCNARWLLGLTFLFAALRKALAAEYLTTETFHFLLLNDNRFADVAEVIGGMEGAEANRAFRQMQSLEPTIPVPHSPRLMMVARVLTWWTLIVESLVAYCFIGPGAQRLQVVANFLLMAFIVAVYSIAPVLGFATILIILGYAQCPQEFRKTRIAYLLVYLFIQIFSTRHVKTMIFEQLGNMMS